MLDRLKNAELSVWIGDNHFTMSRGSFRYRQNRYGRVKLVRESVEEIPGGFRIHCQGGGEAFLYEVREIDGLIRVSLSPLGETRFNRYQIAFPVPEDPHIYGCGEIHSHFDLKGLRVRIFVAEHQNVRRISGKLIRKGLLLPNADRAINFERYESYYSQPTFVTSDKWFLHCEAKTYSKFDFSTQGRITVRTQEPPVCWIGRADTYEQLSETLTGLVGRQKALPDWIYDGAILAIQEGTQTVEEKIRKAEACGTKVCGVWAQDWCGCRRTGFGYQVMWNWQWDKELYPDLDRKILEWKERGIHFLGYINPFLAIEKELYQEASEKGYCVKDKNGKDYLVTITTFPAAMVDFTNPKAYEWYKSIIKENMIGLGLSGWMADFGEYLPIDCVLHSGEDPYEVHNLWPVIWARMNEEAIRETGKEDEIFFFTRAGYTGTQEHSPMMWTGDHHVDWSMDDGIGAVIPATLSLAMSGFGITHSDAGGYTTVSRMTRSKELLMRWEELCIFSPLFRLHEGNQPSRNVQFDADEELLSHTAFCSRVHAALKPYLKELEAENTARGVPVMRPLFYHYEEEPAYTESTEYLLGRDILVAPVLKKNSAARMVWFPEDRWVHLFTGEEYSGGRHRIKAPIGCPPVFIRKGSRYTGLIDQIKEIGGVTNERSDTA